MTDKGTVPKYSTNSCHWLGNHNMCIVEKGIRTVYIQNLRCNGQQVEML